MKELSYLEYQGLNNGQKFIYKLKKFFCAFGGFFARIGSAIASIVKTIVFGTINGTKNLFADLKVPGEPNFHLLSWDLEACPVDRLPVVFYIWHSK